ncbi:MAG: hypothetical protein JOZ96_13430 [Acidobacteria bacterium]|nr:hypothetical protein [Acidobacteriota bacterium]
MKSLSLVLLLLVLSPGGARAQEAARVKSDAERAGLAGRVKYVEVGRVEYTLGEGGSAEGVRLIMRRTSFDERGNKTEEVSYDQGGSPSSRVAYTFDEAGRNTGYEEYASLVDTNLKKPRRHAYKFDEAGRRVEYNVYDSDGTLAQRFTYAYDAAGNKTEEAFYTWQGQRAGRLAYTYDARGQLLTETSYNAADAVVWRKASVYDAEGRLAETAQYQGQTLRYRFFYKYDAKGRVKEQETREFNAVPNVRVTHAPEPGRVVYTYDDEKGTKEVATYDARGALKQRLLYGPEGKGDDAGAVELNADGSVKNRELRWYDKGGQPRTLSGAPSAEFAYDEQGNWTRKTLLIRPAGSEQPVPYWAEFREIVYY